MSDNEKINTSSGDKSSSTSTKGIFWDAFDYISDLVSRVWSSGDSLGIPSKSVVPPASAPASTDECKDVFTGISSYINASTCVINISINRKTLQLHLPDILGLSNSSIGLVALSDNELVALPNFNESNRGQQISMTQYYRADSSNNCVVIHLTATTTTPTKLTCERYICVHYGEDKMIVSKPNNFDTIIDYSEFKNWDELNKKCAGIVPNPSSRRKKTEYKYLFNNTTYRGELQSTIIEDKKANKDSLKAKAPTTPGSVYSPVEAMIKEMGTSLKMDDMMKHGVNGLSEVAVKRYNGDIDRLNSLNTHETIQSIKNQLNNNRINKKDLQDIIKTTCAINDFTDLAHDVRTLQYLDDYINLVFPKTGETQTKYNNNLRTKLKGLLTTNNNINVPNSHKIQEDNVKELKQFLLDNGIIIPNIPTDKYESRYEMYVQLIVDLMQGVKRSNYPESGKQITIETFYEFYKKLDTDNQILFCQDVQNRIDEFPNTNAVASSSASAPKSSNKYPIANTSNNIFSKMGLLDKTAPSVKKICGLDGCAIGVVDDTSGYNNYTIPNIYGLYDFNIRGSNRDEWNITITRHDDTQNPKTELLTWTGIPGDFHIILDDVIWYVKKINSVDLSFASIQYRNKKYNTSGESDSQKQYMNIKFGTTTTYPHEQTLLVFSLKTAMDKLYRLSGKELTEIGTIDSYVWGDVYIQYFLGKLDNLLMIYRVSDATGDGEQDDGECDVDTHALGGRGLVVHPMVKNVYTNEEGILLMKKTLVYANWLQQLANMSVVSYTYQPSSPSQTDGAYSREVPIPLKDVFGLKDINNGKLFNTAKENFGSLIPTGIRMSYRLLNFVERFALNRDIKARDDYHDEYDMTMVQLFNSECDIVIQRVKKYIPKLQKIMSMSLTDKPAIRKAIVELPNLEILLSMSSPTFYVDNEDTLIDMSSCDTPRNVLSIITMDMETSSSNDSLTSSQDSLNEKSVQELKQAQNINLFTDVEFLDNGNISITSSKASKLADMAKDTNNEYTSKIIGENNVITGPITLELLYKLKKCAHDDSIREKITGKIDEIIEAFERTFLSDTSDADTAYSSSDDAGMSATSYVSVAATGQPPDMNLEEVAAYDRGYQDGLNNSHAKSTGIQDSISRAYESGYKNAIETGSGATHVQDNGSNTPDGTGLQMDSGSGSESDNEMAQEQAKAQAQAQALRQQERVLPPIPEDKRKKSMSATARGGEMDARQLRVDGQQVTLNPRPPDAQQSSFRYGTTKRGTKFRDPNGGNRNNSTRKRRPSKMPRRTIRRRAPIRGKKRTIRRQRRNKKGTQRRRK